MNDYEDIPKYQKRAKHRSIAKANHKHVYKSCLLLDEEDPIKAEYCVCCGKIGKIDYLMLGDKVDGHYRILTSSEILNRYSYLPKFRVYTRPIKYVDISTQITNE